MTAKGYRRMNTAPRPTEENVQQAIIERLQWHGWEVAEISQPHRVSGGLIGVVDLIAVKSGVTLFIETKRPGGRLRESQKDFARRIAPHVRSTLCYCVANNVDDFAHWLAAVESQAGVDTVKAL